MNQPDLFPATQMAKLSPRLEWMKRHNIHTRCLPGNCVKPWQAWVRGAYETRRGATEEDALYLIAELLRIPLWNEEKHQQTAREPSP